MVSGFIFGNPIAVHLVKRKQLRLYVDSLPNQSIIESMKMSATAFSSNKNIKMIH